MADRLCTSFPLPFHHPSKPSILWVFTFFRVGGNCHIRMQDFHWFFLLILFYRKTHINNNFYVIVLPFTLSVYSSDFIIMRFHVCIQQLAGGITTNCPPRSVCFNKPTSNIAQFRMTTVVHIWNHAVELQRRVSTHKSTTFQLDKQLHRCKRNAYITETDNQTAANDKTQ